MPISVRRVSKSIEDIAAVAAADIDDLADLVSVFELLECELVVVLPGADEVFEDLSIPNPDLAARKMERSISRHTHLCL